MARPQSSRVSPYRLRELISKLQRKNNNKKSRPLRVGKRRPRRLIAMASFEAIQTTIETEVKIAILETDGQNNPDPASLSNKEKMSSFGFTDMQYISLTKKFVAIARKRKPSAKVDLKDVMDCETVQDCIDLVTKATK